MPRPLSQLIYRTVQDGGGTPRVITLHAHNQRALDARAYGIAASPTGRVIGLESFKGVYVGRSIVGYTWFIGPAERPSPLFFGDALAEVERFLWDEIDRQKPAEPELPFLVGIGQGAVMAISAAVAVPDLLSGVIAIGGGLPVVPGWSPPLAPLDALPMLLTETAEYPEMPGSGTVLTGPKLAETLEGWGAAVSRITAPYDALMGDRLREWTAKQPVRRHGQAGPYAMEMEHRIR